ncbi:VOC family protein [Candidatus Methylocalor cossyra]|uniref:VOC domain-containing protein n=1 Tax=Candidatus Methylocalor cossyra TaxID=3108543 RepID=A0ABM9NLQ3_9GAMM
MGHPFVHVELQTHDLPKARDFYQKLFDWQLEEVPLPGGGGTYTLIKVGEGTGGGMFANPDPNVPPHWLAYVGVEDVRAMTEKAKSLGATVCVEVMEVGEYGTMSVIIDPTGAALALWQSKQGQES